MSVSREFAVQGRPQIRVLSNDQLHKIHLASLEILERTGVRVFNDEAIALLGTAGADIVDQTLVRIPSYLVDEALRTAPKRVVLSDRNGNRSLFLEELNPYFGGGTDTPNIMDPFSGKRRQAVKRDVKNVALLCDYLPNINFVACMGIASDVDSATSDRHHFEQMVFNTTKPIMFTAWDREGLADIYGMCVAVAGNAESFRRNPFVVLYAEPSSPLQHSAEAIQKLNQL
jgi:trimethylamine--corrinoid protein Co-methyltransferase